MRPPCLMFQSTHSLRSATRDILAPVFGHTVSIHALLAECDFLIAELGRAHVVSIHALLAECDNSELPDCIIVLCFNPRTPCGVRRQQPRSLHRSFPFQSTHSLRSATVAPAKFDPQVKGFNPRTPCGVRLRLTIYIVIQQRKRYFAPTSRRRPSSPSLLF